MNKIYIYNVINLISELSIIRYNIISKEEYFNDFLMTGKISDSFIIASRMDYKEINEKLKTIFSGGEYLLLDITKSITDKTYVIDTMDTDISRLKRLFADISKANNMVAKDKAYFGDDNDGDDNDVVDHNVHIPTIDELLDKISENGIESLDAFEKKLLDDYSK